MLSLDEVIGGRREGLQLGTERRQQLTYPRLFFYFWCGGRCMSLEGPRSHLKGHKAMTRRNRIVNSFYSGNSPITSPCLLHIHLMMDDNGFPYDPLTRPGGVRLIMLQPGSSKDDIHCTVGVADLPLNPQYEALSYEWGTTDYPRYIFLDRKYLTIRQNLWWALFHLQFLDRPRTLWNLWIDALCVNQIDVAERNHQVSQMDMIYQQAANVVAWLGRESPSDSKALQYMKEILADSPENYQNQRSPDFSMHRFRIHHMLKWNQILTLFQRSYWGRLWIIQEVV
jgi:hypothetical protein